LDSRANNIGQRVLHATLSTEAESSVWVQCVCRKYMREWDTAHGADLYRLGEQ